MKTIASYRTIAMESPFTVETLETYCAALRMASCNGDTPIGFSYKSSIVTLTVRIDDAG